MRIRGRKRRTSSRNSREGRDSRRELPCDRCRWAGGIYKRIRKYGGKTAVSPKDGRISRGAPNKRGEILSREDAGPEMWGNSYGNGEEFSVARARYEARRGLMRQTDRGRCGRGRQVGLYSYNVDSDQSVLEEKGCNETLALRNLQHR